MSRSTAWRAIPARCLQRLTGWTENEKDGRWRIVDFKTGDNGETPEDKHHTSVKHPKTFRWKELQLPLYRHVARQAFKQDAIEVAYWNLPAEDKQSGVQLAGWDAEQLTNAEAKIAEVVTNIRAGAFWPPEEAADV